VPQLALPLLAAMRVFFFQSRRDTAIEILALRQQVAILKRKQLSLDPRRIGSVIDRVREVDETLASTLSWFGDRFNYCSITLRS